ncbi:MAG: nuclear transport factor 2 family protein [Thiohalocapsa sp.]
MTDMHERVEDSYRVVWDARDMSAIREMPHPAFRFRGLLGQETRGHAEFAEYLDMLHGALEDYRCTIEDAGMVDARFFGLDWASDRAERSHITRASCIGRLA